MFIVKTAVGIVVSTGANIFVKEGLKRITPDNLNKIAKISAGAFTFVAGAMVGDAAAQYANKVIDDTKVIVEVGIESIKGTRG